MKQSNHETIIIGAGLSGLTAAYELQKSGGAATVFEAADRLGGRLYSVPGRTGPGPFEMGATWFGEKHGNFNTLIRELGIGRFEQYAEGEARYEVMSFLPTQSFELPYGKDPYYRVRGGSSALIETLMKRVGAEHIRLNARIIRIVDQVDHLVLKDASGQTYKAGRVVLTVPPKLAEATINFEPSLPLPVREAMQQTHTWMSSSIKFWVEYDRPFWREQGLAGMAISQVGIVQEVHDHTNYELDTFALMGFLSAKAHRLSSAGRESETVRHLQRLFSDTAGQYVQYVEKVWAEEQLTSTSDMEILSYHPGYGHPALQQGLLGEKLLLSGTETSEVYGGYMEGAVYAGQKAAMWALKNYEK